MTDTQPQSKARPNDGSVGQARRTFTGVVVSDKMDKTIVVRVDRTVIHPKYGKRYQRSRKFKVHDEANAHKTGEQVTFVECRPYSRDKRWRVVKTIS